ncbi:MAG: LysE family transporter [Acetobacterium woodii]|nr:LysE family transporter [Acetobacterium woodii]
MFSLFNFLTYAMITAITPGPNNIMSMSIARQYGFKRALPFNLGVFAGFSVVMLICTYFFATLSAVIPMIKAPMILIGAAYMLYLAWKTFKSSSPIEARPIHSGFLNGLMLQFVNPKVYLYCLISMEVYILPAFSSQPGMLFAFALLLALIGFCFTLCWSVFGTLFQRLFSTQARLINTILALLLVYCAIALFFE